jgi:RNA polymerase sigma-70 factor (ECF subfamily)
MPVGQDAFMRLLLSSERDMLRYVMALVPNIDDARDIVQETAIDLWKKIDKYDPNLPFTPWACRFAAIQVQRHRRQKQRWGRFLDENVAAEILRQRESMIPELDRRREHLGLCMESLPEKQRNLLRAYYYDNKSIEEQSGKTGKSADALYKALQRTRQALMGCIDRRMTKA